jgi:hypothetical protein
MGKKTNDSATSVRSGSLAYFHWHSADLHTFLTQKHMPDRSDIYLRDRLAGLLKLQLIVVNGKYSFAVVLYVSKAQ